MSEISFEEAKEFKKEESNFLDKLKSVHSHNNNNNNNITEEAVKKSLAQAMSVPLTDLGGKLIDDDTMERIVQFR